MDKPALADIYPFGDLTSTLIDEDRLKDLQSYFDERDFKKKVLTVPVAEGKTRHVGEEDMIEHVVKRVKYQFDFAERGIELVGCDMDMSLIKGWAWWYKESSGTPSGTVKTPELAGTDDLVMGFVGPRQWYAIAQNQGNQYNFEQTGVSKGPINVIDSKGLNSAQTGDLTIDGASGWDPWLFFTGDWIDLNADSIITEIEFEVVDDEDYGPTPMYISERATDLHYMLTPGMIVKDSLNIDAIASKAGDHELVPICFYIDSGSQVLAV